MLAAINVPGLLLNQNFKENWVFNYAPESEFSEELLIEYYITNDK